MNVTTQTTAARLTALHHFNTDTYCGDLAHTAFILGRFDTPTAPLKVAALADRIIALRTQELTP
jgi:hypothetical protein